MKHTNLSPFVMSVLMALCLLLLPSTTGALAPTITSIYPTSGVVGYNGVAINTTNTPPDPSMVVTFNGTPAVFSVINATTIIATVPAGATTGKISVTTPGGTAASATNFTVKPALATVSLTTAPLNAVLIGNPVILSAAATGGANVQYKFMAGTSLLRSFSSSSTFAFTPTVAKTYNLTVIARDLYSVDPDAVVTSSTVSLAIKPALSAVSLAIAPSNSVSVGVPVILNAAATGGANVQYKFMAGTSLLRSFNNSSTFTFIPTTVKTYSLTVIARDLSGVDPNATVTSVEKSLVITPPVPTITSFTPAYSAAGTIITITGTNFIGATAVKFNGITAAAFTVVSATSIIATVPGGDTAGKISVTTISGTATSTDDFIGAKITGIVRDIAGKTIAGATLQAGGATATSLTDGKYTLENVTPANMIIIKVQGPAGIKTYLSTQDNVTLSQRQTAVINFTLPEVGNRVLNINVTVPVTVSDDRSDQLNAKVDIPANSLVTDTGTPVATADIAITTVLPKDNHYTESFPGLFVGNKDGVDTPIASYGYVDVTAISGGQELQLASGKTAVITFPIDPDRDPGAGPIEMWYLDETTGKWIYEGTAVRDTTVTPNVFIGTISHLSEHGLNIPFTNQNSLTVTVIDDATHAPAFGATVDLQTQHNNNNAVWDAPHQSTNINGITTFTYIQPGTLSAFATFDGRIGYATWWNPQASTMTIHIPPSIMPTPIDSAEMVWVPGDVFTMGTEYDSWGGEPKTQTVTLSGYWIYKYEVTVKQYLQFCTATLRTIPSFPYGFSWEGKTGWNDPLLKDHPIVNVNWYDCKAYADWAGASLPTEAQWEWAARGPDGNNYPWGGTATPGTPYDGWDDTKCANKSTSSDLHISTWPVGSFPQGASWCGAQDLAGNVWEWCADRFDTYSSTPVTNPITITPGGIGYGRILRGGSWYYYSYNFGYYYRGASRFGGLPGVYDEGIGFRCVVAAH